MRALLLALALVITTGCGGGRVPELPSLPPTAPVVGAADQAVKSSAMYALGLIESAGKVAERALRVEQELAAAGVIPASTHAALTAEFRGLALYAVRAVDVIKSGTVETWPAMTALVDPLIARVQAILDTVQLLGDRAGAFRSWVDALKEIVIDGFRRLVPGGGVA